MYKILLLEDEEDIREFIKINLKREDFEVFEAATGEKALELFQNNSIDVAVLDVMLPGIDGFQVCDQIRAEDQQVGIIMLTAKGQQSDKSIGFESGADDYLIKPFSPKELILRIKALLRRIDMNKDDSIEQYDKGPFTVDFKSKKFLKNGKEIELTQIEFAILELMIKSENNSLSREEILDGVWGEDYFGSYKIVDVNIRRIRKKIEEDPSNPRYIKTIWGYGYRWVLNE